MDKINERTPENPDWGCGALCNGGSACYIICIAACFPVGMASGMYNGSGIAQASSYSANYVNF